jgi:hypothetical protein
VPALRAQQPPAVCRGDDGFAKQIAEAMRELATGTDSADVADRANFAIPAADSSAVQIVTNSSICAQAAQAFYADVPTSVARVPVFVVAVGSVYVVGSPSVKQGEWLALTVYNSDFSSALAHFTG